MGWGRVPGCPWEEEVEWILSGRLGMGGDGNRGNQVVEAGGREYGAEMIEIGGHLGRVMWKICAVKILWYLQR